MKPDSTISEQNKRVVKAMYDAGVNGDAAGFIATVDENAVVHEPAYLPYGGSHRGHQAIGALSKQVNELLDLSTLKVNYMLAEGEMVVTAVRLKSRAGKEVDVLEQSRVRDGKIVDLRIFFFDPTQLMKE